MTEFLHELAEAKDLFEIIGDERGVAPQIVEKDYWIMHGLWGLQRNNLAFEMKGGTSLSKGWTCIDRFSEDIDIAFEYPRGLNIKGEKPAHIEARLSFFDSLAERIRIPDIRVERKRSYDDSKVQNGAIILKYPSLFAVISGLQPEVLLEIGFAKTTPNEPRDFGSWAYTGAMERKLTIRDNQAPGVKCFNPEYTFIEKLQTICRRYRQSKAKNEKARSRPREFLRHYYDLYRLLAVKRVSEFIGTPDYFEYRAVKIRGQDLDIFNSRIPFHLEDAAEYSRFESEYAHINTLILGSGPGFREIMGRIRSASDKF